MNIKDFFASRENPPDLYWSLIIEPGWVQAGIWYIGADVANVISVSPGAAWESEDELVGATDAAISSSIQKLPENYKEPSKTVFGVPSSWVEGGSIKEEHLERIKKVCTELSLEPVGFVIISEAIAHLYKSEEGAPLNAVIIGLSRESIEISIFKLGNLAGSTTVARSVSLIEDVTEGLSRFEGASPLPSRFIVFDGKEGELEEAKEALVRANWAEGEKIKFLHTPKAEIITPDRKVLAASLAGAAEIGSVTKVASEKSEEKFPVSPQEIENVEIPKEKISASDLGFSINEDVSLKPQTPQTPQPPLSTPKPYVQAPVSEINAGAKRYFEKTKNILHNFSAGISSSKVFSGKKSIIGVVVLILLVAIGFGLFWWFVPKAKVSITVTPKKFEQEVDVAFSLGGESDLLGALIPATEVSAEVSGDKTQATTGKKVVGDKGKGSVQIRNGTAFPINLSTGTFLVSSGNLKFTIDNSASVSAALSPNSPGTSNVTATADSIGAEYNLGKDEIFRVGNYPKAEVDATATSDFTGGSSREILAVNKGDQDSLEKALKDELSQNAKDEIAGKTGGDQIFVDDLASLEIANETFDRKIGDEAGNLKLSLTVRGRGIMADSSKFLEFARNSLKDKIPEGYVLRDSQISYKFTFVNEENGKLNYKVLLSANFLPQANVDEIIKRISGRSPSVARNYLSGIPGFVRVGFTLTPALPGPFGNLPNIRKNISIEFEAEQ